jgi:hypothetical protein
MFRTFACLATLSAAAALHSGEAAACPRERIVTPYWTSAPTDLAADEIVVEVKYLGDPDHPPSTMSASTLVFRATQTVEGEQRLEKDTTLHVIFQARCRTLLVQPAASRPLLLVGKLVTRWPLPLIEPRYRDCTRDHAAETSGNSVWVCPLAPTKPDP